MSNLNCSNLLNVDYMRYLGIKNINIMNEAALKLLYVNCEKLYTNKKLFLEDLSQWSRLVTLGQ